MRRGVTKKAVPAEANVHEHIARAMYYFSVHLLFASIVAAAAWALTSILHASATTKYWVWVVTAFNFVLPSGALIDELWAPHLTWARPLAAIGDPVWDMAPGRAARDPRSYMDDRSLLHASAFDVAYTQRAS